MLRLFQTGVCRRLPYLIVLVCLMTFDFAKDPIQVYLEGATERLQVQISDDEASKLNETFGALGRKLDNTVSAEERAKRQKEQVSIDTADVTTTAIAMEAKRSAVWSAYIATLVAMGVLSYIVLIWMVFARVRDIAWPNWVGFAILTLPLFVRLFGSDVPIAVFYTAQGAFALALLGLAIVPTSFGAPTSPAKYTTPRARIMPGRFGQRM